MPFRLCFVGYGAIAWHHASIMKSEGAVLDSVVGRVLQDTARFAAEFGFEHYSTNLLETLEGRRHKIDAVIIASPNELHYEHTKHALQADKHVLCEIPLAMSYAQGGELVELAKGRAKSLMVAHSTRFNPALMAVRNCVKEGSFHIRHVVGRELMFRLTNVGWTGRRRSWTDSIVWHHGGHVVDACLWLLGATEVEVQANLARPAPRTGSPLDMSVLMRTPSDQLATVALSYNARTGGSDYVVIGEEETYHYAVGVLRTSQGAVLELSEMSGGNEIIAWEAQDREFLASLREERAPASSGLDILPSLAVLQQVQDRLP